MAQFKTDLRDIYFNLFNVLKIQEHTGVGESDMKDVIGECNKFMEKEVFPTRTVGDHTGVKLENGKEWEEFERSQASILPASASNQ